MRSDAASDVLVRPAVAADAAGLVPLLAILGYPADADVLATRMAALQSADPSGLVLVALRAGVLVGFATLHETPVLHRPTAVGRVTAIAVAPTAQGSGAGRALISAAEQHFRARGLGRLEITSGPTHLPAHAFYRHLGYQDQGVRFSRTLDSAQGS